MLFYFFKSCKRILKPFFYNGRKIPVGSIDALVTWEDTISGIPLRPEYIGQNFYMEFIANLKVRQKAVNQVMERL